MGFVLAITIFAAAFLMQTATSIPVGDLETTNSTVTHDQDTVNATLVDLEDLCPCPKCYDPVCGSDNHTYGNKCLFDCAKEKRNQDLEIQFYGDCDGNQLTITIDECNFIDEDVQNGSKQEEEEKEEDDSKSTSEEDESKSTAEEDESKSADKEGDSE